MSLKKPIQTFSCWLVAVALLVVTMGSLTRDYPLPTNSVEQSEVEQTQDSATSDETSVSELRLDAVVIGLYHFHFSPYALPIPQVAYFISEKSVRLLPSRFKEPLFFFKYFLKVFGKQIAANAP